MTEKIINLEKAFMKAKEAARAAMTDDDGGTCNFDSPLIILPRWKEADVKEACDECDLHYWKEGAGRFVITGFTIGQGNCRTAMAEAFTKSMGKDGYEAFTRYVTD